VFQRFTERARRGIDEAAILAEVPSADEERPG
jgi:hypothetical protein